MYASKEMIGREMITTHYRQGVLESTGMVYFDQFLFLYQFAIH